MAPSPLKDEQVGEIQLLRTALVDRVHDWSGLDRVLFDKLKINLDALGVDIDVETPDSALKQLASLAAPMKILRDNQLHLAKIIQSLIQINLAIIANASHGKPDSIAETNAQNTGSLGRDDLVKQVVKIISDMDDSDWQGLQRGLVLSRELDEGAKDD